jgi:hypothetical protein
MSIKEVDSDYSTTPPRAIVRQKEKKIVLPQEDQAPIAKDM